MTLTPTNRHNPCGICEDNTGRCRQSTQDQDYWQCMTYADTRKGDAISGYKCLGHSKNGLWGQFRIDNSTEWTEQQREEWKRQNRQRQQQKVKEDERRRQRSLSAIERDKGYQQLLSELTLHPDDRADLLRRGFTAAQIELSGFRSISRYQQLQGRYNELLPGVIPGKNRLIIRDEGYLCPIRNAEGLIVACQIRLRTLPMTESSRYRWLSGDRQTLHLFPDGSNGELPLAVFKPLEKPSGVALTEGVGTKPFLVSQRLNLLTIGAAGGQWASSPNLFKQSLENADTNSKEVKIFPDAGDVHNRHVMTRWQKVVELLGRWGYEVKFGWWNQTNKTHPDIDELKDFSAIQYISPDEFFKMTTENTPNQAHNQTSETRHKEAEEAIYQSLTTIQEKPWKTINTEKINLEELLTEPGVIYIVSSAKGTHKTNALIPVVKSQDKVLAWFNRVALGREECNRVGLTWKDETKSYSNKNKRGFCADSSFQFDPNILADKGLLIGDECDQVFAHMFGDTCNKDGKRPLILATLEAHINSAIHGGGMALFMSADVTQRDIDYIKALAPEGCPVRLIVNEFKPERGTVYFDTSDKPDGKIEELLMKLEEGEPCFVIDDIKNGARGCKSIAEYIRSVHPEWADEIIEINSDTSGDQFIVDYLKNINEASKKTRLMCCSPSVVSGISIENGHFSGVFAFLNGILTVSDASQAIARVRGAEELHIWAAESGLAYEANRSTNPKEIKEWYRRNYEANCKHLLTFKMEYQPITGEWASPHFDLFCKNAAYRNLCMNRLRERLKTRLEEEGYTIVIESNNGSDSVEKALKDGWNQIELAQAQAIAAANILSDDELEALRYSNRPTTPEEKLDLQKTYLLKWFGQELIEATTYEHKSGEVLTGYAAMALKNERGVYREQLENFRLLTSDEDAAVVKDVASENKQLRHSCGRFPGDVRWNTRRSKARRWLDLHQFLNPEKWWQPNDYRAIGQKAKSKASMIKDCLNLATEKISEGQIFGELIQQLGLDLEKEWVTPQPGGRRFKQRRITAESWNHAQMYLTHQQSLREEREFTQKPANVEETAVAEVCDSECANLITPPQIYIESSFLGGGDQKKNQQEVEDLTSSNVAISTPSGDELEQLIQALPFVDDAKTFAAVIEGSPVEIVEDAIAMTDSQPRRKQLEGWLQSISQPVAQIVDCRVEGSEFEQLIESLPFAENVKEFSAQIEGCSDEDVENAIALAPSLPLRKQLGEWYEAIRGATEYLYGSIADRIEKARQGSMGEGFA